MELFSYQFYGFNKNNNMIMNKVKILIQNRVSYLLGYTLFIFKKKYYKINTLT